MFLTNLLFTLICNFQVHWPLCMSINFYYPVLKTNTNPSTSVNRTSSTQNDSCFSKHPKVKNFLCGYFMHKCHICKSIVVAFHGNTSNLQSHMKKHKKEYDQIQNKINTSANVQPSTSTI